MRARVFSSLQNYYFVSEVLAIVNSGYYEKYLVVDHKEGGALRLVDFLDKSKKETIYPVNVNIIDYRVGEEWITKSIEIDDECNKTLDLSDKDFYIYEFKGYRYIYNHMDIITKLLKNKEVFLNEYKFENLIQSSDIKGWTYLRNNNDIEYLMKAFHGFHDSVLRELNYISGSGKSENGGLYSDDRIRTITVKFDSLWSDSIELVFSGVMLLNLRPAGDNYSADIFDAFISIKDEIIYFFLDNIKEIDESYEGTWFKALEVRWRYTT